MQSFLKKILFTLLCCSNAIAAYTQNIPLDKLYVRHINQKDGLLFNTVYCFLQDSKNYIWMGGLALQRYDGYRFKNYFNGSENINTYCLLEDKDKQIWAGTDKGLYKLNILNDKFELFADSIILNNKKELIIIQNMVADKDGNIWMGCKKYYARLIKNATEIENVSALLNHTSNGFAHFLSIDASNKLWVENSSEFGVTSYDISNKKIINYNNNPSKNSLFNLPLKNLAYLQDGKGNIWMHDGFNSRVLNRYNLKDKKNYTYNLKIPPQFERNKISSVPGYMFLDKRGDFWIQLNEHFGLAKYNIVSNNFEYLFSNKNTENGLYDDFSLTNGSLGCYIDKEDNIWYCGDGVNVLNPSKQMFVVNKGELNLSEKLQTEIEEKKLSTTPNGFVQMNDGYNYMCYYGDGLWQFDENFNPIKKINLPKNIHQMLWCIFTTDKENLFFADQNRHLFTFNIRTKSIKQIPITSFPENHVTTYFVQDKENVWLGLLKNGIALFNTKTFKTDVHNIKPIGYEKPFGYVTTILPETENTYWISAANGGLHLFDKKTGTVTKSWYPNPRANSSGKENHINGIELLGKDSVFLCTDAGVIILNKQTMQHTTISIKGGLPDNSCYGSLIEKNNKFIWISTANKGLCRFNVDTKTITTFPASEGNTAIHGDIFKQKLQDDRFFFSNNAGFTIFNPYLCQKNDNKPIVTVTEIWVNDEMLLLDSAVKENSIRLSYKLNNLKIKFSALNIWQAEKIKYFIKINNATTWTKLGNVSEVEYLDLPPGSYNLTLAATLQEDPTNINSTKIKIIIEPPFYKTNWFLFLCALLLGILLYRFFKWRLAQERKQAALKQKLAESEMQVLRSQMNPHFIFNSLNSIENFIMQNEKRLASDYLNKFARLIRMILDSSRNEVVPIAKDMETLQLYIDLELLRFNNKFIYRTSISDALLTGEYSVPSLIIQPYVENAIVHGLAHSEMENLSLTVSAIIENDCIKYTIEDNGIGRQQAAVYNLHNKPQHKSVGLLITEDRINNFNNNAFDAIQITDLFNNNNNACGTKIEITLKAI